MRTLIEQFVRDQANKESRNSSDFDKLMDDYYLSLPDEFKDIFPSLRGIYSRLSIDIHAANASSDDFEKSLAEIKSFFSGLKTFPKEHIKKNFSK